MTHLVDSIRARQAAARPLEPPAKRRMALAESVCQYGEAFLEAVGRAQTNPLT